MSDSADVLASELDRLRKFELIDIIINAKLPDHVTSEPLINFVKKFSERTSQKSDGISESENLDRVHKLNTPETEYLNLQIKYLQELLTESSDKNNILKQNNNLLLEKIQAIENKQEIPTKNQVNNKKDIPQSNTPEIPSNIYGVDSFTYAKVTSAMGQKMAGHGNYQTQKSQNDNQSNLNPNSKQTNTPQETVLKHNNSEKDEEDAFTEIKRKKRRRARVPEKNIGTGQHNPNFSGQERKVWIYIYRVKRNTTPHMIEEYLSTKEELKDTEITVKEIPSDENRLKRFVLSAPLEMKEVLYKSDTWPSGVGIKRFDFSRHRELLKQGADFL